MTNLTLKNRAIDTATMLGKNQLIGGFLLDAGKISQVDAERILRLQKEKGLRFGDAAKSLGLITEEDIQQVLAQQFEFSILPSGDGKFSSELIAAYQPFSKQVDTLRSIRSQLMLRCDGCKVLIVVSPGRGEGRSYFAANLAIVFSQLGERTLLIDADFRQPRQDQLFKLEQTQGLSDLLAGRVDASVVARIPEFRCLSVLPAGTIPPNPLELIGRGMTTCLTQFAKHYDVILIDTPASEQGTDSQILTAKAGGALLLARQHKTRLADLEKLKLLFESTGTVWVGAVINDF